MLPIVFTKDELDAIAESLDQAISDGLASDDDDPIVSALQKIDRARAVKKRLTLAELESIVLKISNVTHCRYFKHFNHPCEDPWLMAVQFCNPFRTFERQETLKKELLELGFEKVQSDGIEYYTIERIQ